jgi:hypothetical protein
MLQGCWCDILFLLLVSIEDKRDDIEASFQYEQREYSVNFLSYI